MRTNEIRYRSVFGLLIFFSVVPTLTVAQTREQTLQAISKLHGPERETKVREGARKEGNLIWYSSTTADDSLVLSQKFQEIYPFVKVQHLRGPSEKMVERILLESRAGSFKADVVALPEIELELLVQRKLLLKHAGLEQKIFPANVRDPQEHWTGIYLTAWATAYNTKLVPAQTAPKGYADLLNPKWKGLIGMDVEPYSWFITSYRYLEGRQGAENTDELFQKAGSPGYPVAQRALPHCSAGCCRRVSVGGGDASTRGGEAQSPRRAGRVGSPGWSGSVQ